jgi:hypothetical protein
MHNAVRVPCDCPCSKPNEPTPRANLLTVRISNPLHIIGTLHVSSDACPALQCQAREMIACPESMLAHLLLQAVASPLHDTEILVQNNEPIATGNNPLEETFAIRDESGSPCKALQQSETLNPVPCNMRDQPSEATTTISTCTSLLHSSSPVSSVHEGQPDRVNGNGTAVEVCTRQVGRGTAGQETPVQMGGRVLVGLWGNGAPAGDETQSSPISPLGRLRSARLHTAHAAELGPISVMSCSAHPPGPRDLGTGKPSLFLELGWTSSQKVPTMVQDSRALEQGGCSVPVTTTSCACGTDGAQLDVLDGSLDANTLPSINRRLSVASKTRLSCKDVG